MADDEHSDFVANAAHSMNFSQQRVERKIARLSVPRFKT
jgi:hypothetical protein